MPTILASSSNPKRIVIEQGELDELVCSEEVFFLSWELYELHKNASCCCKYLSLGGVSSSWARVSLAGVPATYEKLLKHAFQKLYFVWGPHLSQAQTRVLFGNMLLMLAGLIERIKAQLDLFAEAPWNYFGSGHFEISAPRTSKQSNQLIKSQNFEQLVQTLVLRNRDSRERGPVFIEVRGVATAAGKWSQKERLYRWLSRILAPMTRNNRVLITGSYLGRLREAQLNLRLRQMPLLAEVQDEPPFSAEKFNGYSIEQTEFDEDACLGRLVDLVLPKNCLQTPSATLSFLERQGWPRSPDVIFTSNSFDSDDAFKMYLAYHLDNVDYVVGQHGNNYGVTMLSLLLPEVVTADLFLSWGESGYENGKKVGVIKPLISLKIPAKRESVLLILRDPMAGFLLTDTGFANKLYEDAVSSLVDRLLEKRVQVKVRPHWSTSADFTAKLENLFSHSALFSICDPKSDLASQLSTAFPLFTYDSSGMLELACNGLDFLAFIPDGLDHVREELHPLYGELATSGVIATETDVALAGICRVIENGFSCDFAQKEAISNFSSRLAVYNRNVLSDIAGLLRTLRLSRSSPESTTQSF